MVPSFAVCISKNLLVGSTKAASRRLDSNDPHINPGWIDPDWCVRSGVSIEGGLWRSRAVQSGLHTPGHHLGHKCHASDTDDTPSNAQQVEQPQAVGCKIRQVAMFELGFDRASAFIAH